MESVHFESDRMALAVVFNETPVDIRPVHAKRSEQQRHSDRPNDPAGGDRRKQHSSGNKEPDDSTGDVDEHVEILGFLLAVYSRPSDVQNNAERRDEQPEADDRDVETDPNDSAPPAADFVIHEPRDSKARSFFYEPPSAITLVLVNNWTIAKHERFDTNEQAAAERHPAHFSASDLKGGQLSCSNERNHEPPIDRLHCLQLLCVFVFFKKRNQQTSRMTSKQGTAFTQRPSVGTTRPAAVVNQETANAYQLNPSKNPASLGAAMSEGVISVAASLTPEQRDQLAYSLDEIVPSCIIDNQACNMELDFSQVYDVDYASNNPSGYCYTFNPNSSYITTQTGSLQMILYNNVSDYLPNTEQVGFKVVIHSPDYYPFPNTEGYFVAVGTQANFEAVKDDYTRLSSPYGKCDSLESMKERGLSFYYTGEYSTEGCLRSCYQDTIVEQCGCVDARFPYKQSDIFCSPLDADKYQCYQDYVALYGDHGNANCTCYAPCEETAFIARLSQGQWPSGTFFEETYCPLALTMGVDCKEYYAKNAARLLVYYGALTWESLDEVPTVTLLDLFNEMSGNLGLWWATSKRMEGTLASFRLGLTAVTIGELILVLLQTMLWCCRCKRELPDVPSFHRKGYPLGKPPLHGFNVPLPSAVGPPTAIGGRELGAGGDAKGFSNWLIVGEDELVIDDLIEYPISTHYNSFTLLQY
ncbi:Degenerin unc-8 [Aphelenchoides fujianensis]|nr:Degenerin unc-8 [Aphelenchoides fujianensis]